MSAPRLPMRNSCSFGRRQPFVLAEAIPAGPALSSDLRLFLTTYAAGLFFMTVFLA